MDLMSSRTVFTTGNGHIVGAVHAADEMMDRSSARTATDLRLLAERSVFRRDLKNFFHKNDRNASQDG